MTAERMRAADAVRRFLLRCGLWSGDVLTVDHPHNGKISVDVADLITLSESLSWHPIETAPRSGHGFPRCYVLVRGPSGMAGIDHPMISANPGIVSFVIKAYHDAEYRPNDPWCGVDNEALSDHGWEPTEWMEVPE